jgi:hypothetical protein
MFILYLLCTKLDIYVLIVNYMQVHKQTKYTLHCLHLDGQFLSFCFQMTDLRVCMSNIRKTIA